MKFLVSDNPKSAIQNLKWAGFFSTVIAFTLCGARTEAQQATKVARIGYLTGASLSSVSANTEAFRQGLRELGYVEGKNIVIEWRAADGNRGRQLALAAELVRLKVDVIVENSQADRVNNSS